jgi:hypothetical protein
MLKNVTLSRVVVKELGVSMHQVAKQLPTTGVVFEITLLGLWNVCSYLMRFTLDVEQGVPEHYSHYCGKLSHSMNFASGASIVLPLLEGLSAITCFQSSREGGV